MVDQTKLKLYRFLSAIPLSFSQRNTSGCHVEHERGDVRQRAWR